MNIAFLCNDITTRGGIERVTANLASLFTENGHDVTIISIYRENKSSSYALSKDVKIEYINQYSFIRHTNLLSKSIAFVKATHNIKILCKKKDFDVIISQATRASIHCYLAGLSNKTIASEHFKYGLYSGIRLKLRNMLYKKFALVSVLTHNDYKQYKGVGIEAVMIPNMGLLKTRIHKNNTISKQKTIVSLGRLHHQKGFDLLIKAIPQVINTYPDWKFVIYGEGEEKSTLEDLIKKEKIEENIELKGYCDDLDKVFSNVSFFVLSSRYEGFPMCLLESMSYNVPIVAFNCPEGPSELLKNNAGLLIDPENIEQLSAGIIYMIEHPNKTQEMAENAQNNLKEYMPNEIYKKWIKAFEYITKRNTNII